MDQSRDTGYRVGAWVVDEASGELGRVMGHEGPRYQLRPPRGGKEWEAAPGRIRVATAKERADAGVKDGAEVSA